LVPFRQDPSAALAGRLLSLEPLLEGGCERERKDARAQLARGLAPCTQMKHHEMLPLVPISRAKGSWL